MIVALGVSFLLITLFYSGFGFNFAGLGALGKALVAWQHKGDIGEGHSKPFIYWCQLLMRAEPWAVFGLLACLRYLVPPLPRPQRWAGAVLLVFGLGVAVYELSPARVVPGRPHPRRRVGGTLVSQRRGVPLGPWHPDGRGVRSGSVVPGVPRLAGLAAAAAGGVRSGHAARLQHHPYKTPWCAISFHLAVLLHGRPRCWRSWR